MQLIGTPSEPELGFLNENAKRYIRQLPQYPRQSFHERFPTVHPQAIDLVEKMLTFDPRQRITGEHLTFNDFMLYFYSISSNMLVSLEMLLQTMEKEDQ